MMMWMLRRTRKMMRLRRMMLRRKSDPKTGKHTLCEPAQSKCAWTFHKSHFVWKIIGKMPDANPATLVLCEPAVEMHMDISQESFHVQIHREKCQTHMKTPRLNTGP